MRHLDPGEAYFFVGDLVSCRNFVCFAERTGHLEPQRIRAALDAIQRCNQLLQVKVTWDDAHGLCFVDSPDRRIELECHDLVDNGWQSLIEQELSRPFAADEAPLVRCLYVQMRAPDRSVLAACFHHSVADGRSAYTFVSQLLEHTANGPPPRTDVQVLALPPMQQVFPLRYQWAKQPAAAKGAVVAAMMRDLMRHGPVPAIPWLSSAAPDRVPKLIVRCLPQDVTLRLAATARQNRASIHGAICAAQLLAQVKLNAGENRAVFMLSTPVDMRAHLEPVQSASPAGLYLGVVSATFAIDADTDFWSLAREIVDQTRLQLARGEAHLSFGAPGFQDVPLAPGQLARLQKTLLTSRPNTMVSNVGRLAEVAADRAVTSISFATCPMPYQSVFTIASTYNDKLRLSLGYDAAKLSVSNAQALADGVHAILLGAAAGVPEKIDDLVR